MYMFVLSIYISIYINICTIDYKLLYVVFVDKYLFPNGRYVLYREWFPVPGIHADDRKWCCGVAFYTWNSPTRLLL